MINLCEFYRFASKKKNKKLIKQNSIEQVFDTVAIEDVVGEFVNLKRRGANLLGLCPFHNEKTPSFTVSPTKGLYKCFGCGKGGSAAGFIMEHEKLSFPEAVKWLANKYNIQIEETKPSIDAAEQSVIDSLYIVNEFAKSYFIEQLWETGEGKSVGLSYFKERGYREDIIKKFELGYSNTKWDGFIEAAKTKGFKLDYAEQLGLIRSKGEDAANKRQYDFFRNRIMFTIHSISGKPIAFAGRTLTQDKKVPKYINSPETEIYNKSRVLYGMAFAKNEIRKTNKCYIVEGYTDVISMHQAGIENVVAASGTSFTDQQIKQIKRFTNNISVLFDGDAAGLKAATRSVEMILEQDMNVKILMLPEGDDPDSFVQKMGLTGFEDYLVKNETDFILFTINSLEKEAADDPVAKAAMIKNIVQLLAKIPDPIKANLYIQSAAAQLNIRERILIEQTNKIKRELFKKHSFANKDDTELLQQQTTDELVAEPQDQIFTNRTETLEKHLASLLIEFGHQNYTIDVLVFQYILNQIKEIEIKNTPYKEIVEDYRSKNELYNEIMSNYEDTSKIINSEFFINHENQSIAKFAVDILASPYDLSKNYKDIYEIYITDRILNYKNDIDNFLLNFQMNFLTNNITIVQQRLKDQQALPATEASEKILMKLLKMYKELLDLKTELAEKFGMVTNK